MHIFYLGVILLVGYGLSVLAAKAGFPKIVGYLIAGLLLNPELVTFIPTDFLDITEPVTTFCLAFITFEIGSSFSIEELKTTGRKYFRLAAFESLGAFLFLFVVFFILSAYVLPMSTLGITVAIAFSLILASFGAPTDPSATLAVIHEYKAKGQVTKSIMGAAAFDDIITLILFSFSLSISRALLGGHELSFFHIVYTIGYKIFGAVFTGLVFGFIFDKTVKYLKIEDRKSLIILFLGFLSLTFGLATVLKFDELFSTLTLGFVIRNYNKAGKSIIEITEHAMEDLFFLIFFVFSALHFSFSSFHFQILILMAVFILVRIFGKFLGMRTGSQLLKMPDNVRKYAFAGLIPQGGIVLGLSLMVSHEPEFKDFSNLLIGIIMGTTIIHEFMGPMIAKFVLRKAGEIKGK
jgi:NhaP-type Na+/H+ or K+/H+ antiporter